MARIRTIKPEFASDVKLATVSRHARLTFVLLITQADDEGLVAAAHRQLLGQLYPHDEDVTSAMLLEWVEELVAAGVVRWRATNDGAPVIELVNWSKHQRVDNKSRSQLSAMLAPFDPAPPPSAVARRGSPRVAANLSESPQVAEVRRLDLGPGTKEQGTGTAAATSAAECQSVTSEVSASAGVAVVVEAEAERVTFDMAFAEYPRRAGGNPRRDAEQAWNARRREKVAPEDMLAGVRRYKAYVQAEGIEGTRFVLQAATFFGPSLRFSEEWPLSVGSDPEHPEERRFREFAAEHNRKIAEDEEWLMERLRARGILAPDEVLRPIGEVAA